MERELKDFVGRLKEDFSEFDFREGTRFKFRSPKVIYYEKIVNYIGGWRLEGVESGNDGLSPKIITEYKMQLLHEVGHARLEHCFFATDLERLKMERAAWDEARMLSEKYEVRYDEEFAEDKLDTYRDWLHQKSLCKICGMTRYQTKNGEYHCPFCEES